MLILTESHFQSAAQIAKLCRSGAGGIRRPAKLAQGQLVLSVGEGETVSGYLQDWTIYTALFSVTAADRLDWVRNDQELTAAVFTERLAEFLALAARAQSQTDAELLFVHWCSQSCWKRHGAKPRPDPTLLALVALTARIETGQTPTARLWEAVSERRQQSRIAATKPDPEMISALAVLADALILALCREQGIGVDEASRRRFIRVMRFLGQGLSRGQFDAEFFDRIR